MKKIIFLFFILLLYSCTNTIISFSDDYFLKTSETSVFEINGNALLYETNFSSNQIFSWKDNSVVLGANSYISSSNKYYFAEYQLDDSKSIKSCKLYSIYADDYGTAILDVLDLPEFCNFSLKKEIYIKPFCKTSDNSLFLFVSNFVFTKNNLEKIGVLPFFPINAVYHDGYWYFETLHNISHLIGVKTYKTEIYKFKDEFPFVSGELIYKRLEPLLNLRIENNEIIGTNHNGDTVDTGIILE